MVPHSPDHRLVFLHCSSIFKGANAQVRKQKKILQLLAQHKSSIKILTDEFTVEAIAVIAKELLDEAIFESTLRARLRFPELFQPSQAEEAEREASEAEVARVEAEAARDVVLTSEDEEEEERPDIEPSESYPLMTDKIQGQDGNPATAEKCVPSSVPGQGMDSAPRLHPIYLPFRTQHRILTFVQSLLEECCLEFGNAWVPDLMKSQNWDEPEAIELTQWAKRFSKHSKVVPSSATKKIAGKSLSEVLFGVSKLRHSAVHRLPTSANGVVNMMSAAIHFAKALSDARRQETIEQLRKELIFQIEQIVHYQTFLERKLYDQSQDFAKRRAEIDAMEKLAVQEMLENDKACRRAAGSSIEDFLVGLQKVPGTCNCGRGNTADDLKTDSKPEEVTETGVAVEDARTIEDSMAQNTETSNFAPPIVEEEQAAKLDDSHSQATEDHVPNEELIARERISFKTAARNPSADKLANNVERKSPLPLQHAIADGACSELYITDLNGPTAPAPEKTTTTDPSSFLMSESSGAAAAAKLPKGLSDMPLHASVATSRPISNKELDFGSSPSVNYTIALKINYDTELLTQITSIEAGTQTAILEEAMKVYSARVLAYESIEPGWELQQRCFLVSVQMDGFEMDLSTYDTEDLTFLIQTISNSAIPTFTVQMSHTKCKRLSQQTLGS